MESHLFRNDDDLEIKFEDRVIPEMNWHYGRECISSEVFNLTPDEFVKWKTLRSTLLPVINAFFNLNHAQACGRFPSDILSVDEIEILLGTEGILSQSERADLLRGQARHSRKIEKIERANSPTNIYLMKDERTGFHKIGFSNKPSAREKTLQSDNPLIVMVGSWPGVKKNERELHECFADKRIRGEWFDLTSEDTLLIQQIMSR